MVIESGLVAGYVIAWAVRKARRAASPLDGEVDAVIDGLLERLHTKVTTKLGGHPVLEDLAQEAATGEGEVSELTRQQVELAVTAAARKDEAFGTEVAELLAGLQSPEKKAGGANVVAGDGARVFTGDATATARDSGIAFGQVGGDVNLDRAQQPQGKQTEGTGQGLGPSGPGRSRP